MKHITLCRRGDSSLVLPAESEYLIVVSDQVSVGSEWTPLYSKTAATFQELKEIIHGMITNDEGVIIQASEHFERLTSEFGLRHLSSEWSNM